MKLPDLVLEPPGWVDAWCCRLPWSLYKFVVPHLTFGVYFFFLKPDLVVSELAPDVPPESPNHHTYVCRR